MTEEPSGGQGTHVGHTGSVDAISTHLNLMETACDEINVYQLDSPAG